MNNITNTMLAEVLSARIQMLACAESGFAGIAAEQGNKVEEMYHKARELAFLEALEVIVSLR